MADKRWGPMAATEKLFESWRTRLLAWPALFCCGLLSCLAFAADSPTHPKPVTDRLQSTFTAANGLPQSTVNAATRTRDGYLWVATQDGLARFDGTRFTVFNAQNSEGLTQSDIRTLSSTRDGTLWIGTRSHGVVHLVDGKFIPYSVHEGLLNPFIQCSFEDSKGTLWFCTLGGLARWRDGKFDGFTVRDGLADNNVEAVAEDRQGRLWVGTGSGLSLLDHNKFVSFPDQQVFAGQPVVSLVADADGVWVGGNKKLVRYSGGRAVTWSGVGGVATSPAIQKLAIDSTGALWVGTMSDGLFRLREGTWERYGTQEGLSDSNIMALFADPQGNLWVGTNVGGLNRLRKRLVTVLGAPEGLSEANAPAVLEDHDGSLWIATPGHGLNHLRNGAIRVYTSRDGLGSDAVHSLWQSPRDGTIWAGTSDGSLQWLEGQRFRHFPLQDHGFVTSILEDGAGNMWLGTHRGLVDIRGGRVVRTYTKNDGLPNSTALLLAAAHDGSLWIGTPDGLSHFSHGTFTNYPVSQSGGTLITSIHIDPDGDVWFTSVGDGLGRLHNGKLSVTTARNGLADDAIYAMADDDAGNLWLNSNRGIIRVAKQQVENFFAGNVASLTARVFDTADGLRSNECYGGVQPTTWKRRNGDLLFACGGGVVEFNPRQLALPLGEPQVHLEAVRINQQEIRPEDLRVPQRIAPGSGNLEFTYTGIDFTAPGQMHFRYRLENFDKDWIDAGTRRTAYYTNIPPGNYRFEVLAENADGVRSSSSASLAFVLEPHFYETALFQGAAVLLLLVLAFAIFRLRIHRMRAHERQLLVLVDERTAALQIEIAERKRTELDLQTARQAAEEARAEAEYKATHDFLSGIYNRAAIIDRLEQEVARAHRAEKPTSLLLVDIDHFKAVNDTYGHLVGDRVIELLVKKVSAELRPYDSIGRFGGDEFLIIIPDCAADEAMAVAERLRSAMENDKFVHGDIAFPVTITIGISTVTKGFQDSTWALQAADSALYAAKRKGRNRTESYHPSKDSALFT